MGNQLTRRTRALRFHSTSLHVVRRDGEVWLRCPQIGDALGYLKRGGIAIDAIYKRHAAEFTDRMTQLLTLPTAGGPQEVRVFSLRGAHPLAMFARTERAVEFRRWVLDVLEQQNQPAPAAAVVPRPARQAPLALPAPERAVPPEIMAAIDRRAFTLSHEAYATLREWLLDLVKGWCLNSRGDWSSPARIAEVLDLAALTDWQAQDHARRVRALLQLSGALAKLSAEWAVALRGQVERLTPDLGGPRSSPHSAMDDVYGSIHNLRPTDGAV